MYAKAAEEGALFTRPQIIGVGDAAQPEMLIGQDKLKELIADAGTQNITMNIYANDHMDVRELTNEVMDRMQHEVNRRGAAFA